MESACANNLSKSIGLNCVNIITCIRILRCHVILSRVKTIFIGIFVSEIIVQSTPANHSSHQSSGSGKKRDERWERNQKDVYVYYSDLYLSQFIHYLFQLTKQNWKETRAVEKIPWRGYTRRSDILAQSTAVIHSSDRPKGGKTDEQCGIQASISPSTFLIIGSDRSRKGCTVELHGGMEPLRVVRKRWKFAEVFCLPAKRCG